VEPLRRSIARATAAALLSSVVALGLGCYRPPDPIALYRDHCIRCHGPDGRGDPARVGLDPRFDLGRSSIVQRGLAHRIYRSIQFGAEGMPAYGQILEHEEIEALAEWIPELLDAATKPTTPSGGDPP
jgi:mono/diheme cytochrome c family protein